MSRRALDRRIFALALPALGALAADPLLSLVDTAFVSRLGEAPLAGLSINGAIFGFAFVVFNFLAYVTTPLVARAIGAGKDDEAVATIARALVLATVLGLGAALFLFTMARPLLTLMQTSGEVLDPALSYLRVRAWAAPAVLITLAAHGGFRGLADTKTPLLIALLANGLNVALDAVFIFGLGMGIAGSALGSVIAQYIGAGVLVHMLVRRTGPLPLARVDWPGMAMLLKPGGLVTMRTLMLVLALGATTATAARLGTSELAAHQVVRETWFLSAMLVDGLAIAAQTLVADARGRLDLAAEGELIRRLLFWATSVGAVFAGLWLLAPSLLAAAFAPNERSPLRSTGQFPQLPCLPFRPHGCG